ncbi:Ehd1 [Symbiodinium necroappetens]|uniref:Ehd1 protein n=1 Tax=Symbiodinium necroappetens TaxID=1628268 RepID=A0A813BBP5_9DINO|nr:Ehd1 [Symbiodinium necroappetens]
MGAAYCRLGRVDSGLELLNEAYAEVSASKDSDWRHSAYLVALTQFGKCMCGFPLLDPSSSALKEALDVKRGLELLLEAREFVMQRPQGPGAMYKGSLKEDISLMIGLVYEFTGNFPAAIEYLKEADASSWQRWLHLHEDSVSDAKEALRVAECSRARSFVALLVAERSGVAQGHVLTNVSPMFKEEDLILGKIAETVRGDLKTPETSIAQESDEDASEADFDARGWRLPIISRRQAQERLTCCYRALIEPVEHLLDGEQHLIIVPDHHLWMLPFAALQLLQLPSGRYLIEKFSIRLAPSVQTLMQISRRREQISRMPAVAPTALVVGVSEFSGHTELQLQPLPSVPSECKAVCDACGRAEIRNSLDSRCDTWSAGAVSFGLTRNAGISACNTGRGSVGADGVFGLTRSFLVAGAGLVMGTLWHTGDASSGVFMSGFYSYLLDSGLPEHVAVQQAMCAMIHETDDRGKLRWRPASWAPFFLVGSASPSPVLGSSRSMEDDNGYKGTVECKTMLANSSGAVRFKPHRFTQTAMHRALESRRARQVLGEDPGEETTNVAPDAQSLTLRAGPALLLAVSASSHQPARRWRSVMRSNGIRQLGETIRQRLFGSEGRLKELPNLMKTPQMIYEEKLRPLEKQLQFESFYDTAELSAAYFTSKPMVLVLGQYSTGKSTLISKLLKAEYPGLRIGPEPTTDKRFGSRFLERFEGALMPEEEVPVLSCLSFVDTPGVLSGDKQRVGRSYDFEGVMGWFAENADLVIVLFDPNKLDISDEFRRCLEALGKKSESKIRFVLNKAEKLDRFELARVFGALMWSLSKVINSPEMPHVFLSPASNQLDLSPEALAFFQSEGERLRQELFQVPLDNTTRKVNDLLRRGRLLRCHALLVQQLLTLRGPFGRRKVLRETITDPIKLAAECAKVAQSSGIPLQDFPSAAALTAQFLKMGDTPVQEVPSPLLRKAEEALSKDIPALLDRVASEREQMIQEGLPMLDLLLDSRTRESAAADPRANPAFPKLAGEELGHVHELQHEVAEKTCQLDEFSRKASAMEAEVEELQHHLADSQQECNIGRAVALLAAAHSGVIHS